jgi:hypothetical protein
VMVGSFNGFDHFGINGGSREDGVGHHFKKRSVGGAVDSASLGAGEPTRGIGVAATAARARRR